MMASYFGPVENKMITIPQSFGRQRSRVTPTIDGNNIQPKHTIWITTLAAVVEVAVMMVCSSA